MNSIWNNYKRIAVFLSLLALVCGGLALVWLKLDGVAYQTTETKLEQTLLLGMSRDDVHKKLQETGSFKLVSLASQPCASGNPEANSAEWFAVKGPSVRWINGYFCFDATDRLVAIKIGND
jgi:hypothetical protein